MQAVKSRHGPREGKAAGTPCLAGGSAWHPHFSSRAAPLGDPPPCLAGGTAWHLLLAGSSAWSPRLAGGTAWHLLLAGSTAWSLGLAGVTDILSTFESCVTWRGKDPWDITDAPCGAWHIWACKVRLFRRGCACDVRRRFYRQVGYRTVGSIGRLGIEQWVL